MARTSLPNIREFQEILIDWYQKNGRQFSWRRRNLTSRQYLIAEILLQRTKAETVEKFFKPFLRKFPSWASLANSNLAAIEVALRPIGLQKQRALRLHGLAVEMTKRRGKLPSDRKELEKIPFLGQYIANAVELIIFKRARPLLDVNMARVLERYFSPRKLADIRYDPFLQGLAQRIVQAERSLELNWAILDFAALVCKTNPMCFTCPLRRKCSYGKVTSYLKTS